MSRALIGAVAIALASPLAVSPAQAAPANEPAHVRLAAAPAATSIVPARAARTVKKAKAIGGRFCPTAGATLGDGFGVSRGNHRHMGIDLMGRRGLPIYAVESGYINRQKVQSNGALQIVLQGASGSKYYYGHMWKNLVKSRQKVTAGQLIGLMGDTGAPGAFHLHFEYWKSGGESAAVDPKPLVVRLCL